MFGYCQKFETEAKMLGTFVIQYIIQAVRLLETEFG